MKKTARAKTALPKRKSLEPGREHGGVQSIARAFAIAEEIARNREGISLAELSKRVGLHNSTTFHLVKTMVQLGYVSQLADSRKYRIGRRMFTLAAGALDEIELVSVATPALEQLTGKTGEYSHFAIRSGDQIVVVAKIAGTGIFQMVDRTGAIRPGHATALGKVLLAALSPSQLERYLDSCELRRFTAKTIVEREAVLRELDEVRRKGLAFDDGEFDAEARCVAVPVRDFTGRVVGAIGISGPIWRLSLQALQDKSKYVSEAAVELSAQLGFQRQELVRTA
jgi:IclR family transcriptional regulator, KDG regulon repressor